MKTSDASSDDHISIIELIISWKPLMQAVMTILASWQFLARANCIDQSISYINHIHPLSTTRKGFMYFNLKAMYVFIISIYDNCQRIRSYDDIRRILAVKCWAQLHVVYVFTYMPVDTCHQTWYWSGYGITGTFNYIKVAPNKIKILFQAKYVLPTDKTNSLWIELIFCLEDDPPSKTQGSDDYFKRTSYSGPEWISMLISSYSDMKYMHSDKHAKCVGTGLEDN